MSLTFLQLSQMVVGFWVNLYAFSIKNRGLECDISYHHLNIGFAIYASYFGLFLNFFLNAYLFGRGGSGRSMIWGKGHRPAQPNEPTDKNGNLVNGKAGEPVSGPGNENSHGYGLRNRVGTNA